MVTPGKTQGDLVASIYTWLKVDSRRIPSSDVQDVINMARKDISRKYKLNYAETTLPITTQVGVNTYTLPVDFGSPFTFRYLDLDSDRWVFLRYRAYSDFIHKPITREAEFEANPDGFIISEDDDWEGDEDVPGAPRDYTWWGRNLILRPTPAAVVTLYFDYFAENKELTDPTQYDNLTQFAWDVLLFKCLEYASLYLLEDQRAMIWMGKADSTAKDLFRAYARARSAARVPMAKEYGSNPGVRHKSSFWWYFW